MLHNDNSLDADLAFEATLIENDELVHMAENSNNTAIGSEGIFLGNIILENIFKGKKYYS